MAVNKQLHTLILRVYQSNALYLFGLLDGLALIEERRLGIERPFAQDDIQRAEVPTIIFLEVLLILLHRAAEGRLITLVAHVQDHPIAVLKIFEAFFVRKLRVSGERHSHASGSTLKESEAPRMLLGIEDLQVSIATQRDQSALHDDSRLLGIRVLWRRSAAGEHALRCLARVRRLW